MIKPCILDFLKKGKNLLAFSYGVDSSALFYLLVELGVEFDLAMLNYKTRTSSDLEEKAAVKLAQKYKKQIFVSAAPQFKNNFEHNARTFRYEFFEKLCLQKGYENVILAHQLNDLFEWFLMQMSKGAGLAELLGMQERESRKHYTLVRPLLNVSKQELLEYLKSRKLTFFYDQSNENEAFFRNRIRHKFSDVFVQDFQKGIKRTFEYLNKDLQYFLNLKEQVLEFENILICVKNESLIAKCVKSFGIVMSAKQRKEALKSTCIVSGKIAIAYREERAFIFAYEKCEKMPKNFKEQCRKARIPKFLRQYCYKRKININELLSFLQKKAEFF